MELPTTLQGHPFGPEQLAQVQALIGQRSDWNRSQLSRELARLWPWPAPQGQLKDMAARREWSTAPSTDRGASNLAPLQITKPTPKLTFACELLASASHTCANESRRRKFALGYGRGPN